VLSQPDISCANDTAIKPEFTRDLIGGSVQFLIVAAVLTLLIKLLKLTDSSAPTIEHRSPSVAIPMVLLSGLSYVIYYLVFGGITYQYFTKQYYPHAPEMAMALGLWFWVIQFTRGTLMTLSVLPAIYSMRVGRWQAALTVGLLIWIVGGAAPLVVPSPMMVTPQRYMLSSKSSPRTLLSVSQPFCCCVPARRVSQRKCIPRQLPEPENAALRLPRLRVSAARLLSAAVRFVALTPVYFLRSPPLRGAPATTPRASGVTTMGRRSGTIAACSPGTMPCCILVSISLRT
jgi:hypothetical protein